MRSGRLEAFSDGVIAIIITIAVLGLRAPESGELTALGHEAPVLLAYALSFLNVGLYWNNHHHLFQAAERIDGRVLWSNLFLLFWLSLVPFVIRWLDAARFAPGPMAAYGVVMGMASIGWLMTERSLIACNGEDSFLARAVGIDRKGKSTLVIYFLAAGLAFVHPAIAVVLYVGAVLAWIVPDRRLERISDR